jgi:excisionase family DNA binding protein
MRVKTFSQEIRDMITSEAAARELVRRAAKRGIEKCIEKDFETIRELSERIGTCYRTVHRAVQAGKIKTVRFGSSRRIPKSEANRIIEQGF